jgi:hypothetical protein
MNDLSRFSRGHQQYGGDDPRDRRQLPYPKPAYLAAIGAQVRPSIRSRRDPRKPQYFPAAWTSRLRQPEDARGDVGRNVLDIRRIHPIRLNNRIGKPASDEADDAPVVRMGEDSGSDRH